MSGPERPDGDSVLAEFAAAPFPTSVRDDAGDYRQVSVQA